MGDQARDQAFAVISQELLLHVLHVVKYTVC